MPFCTTSEYKKAFIRKEIFMAGYALLMFFATILAIGYGIFKLSINGIKKLYRKLHPEKVVLPPPPVYTVERLTPKYKENFNSLKAAFNKAAELYINDARKINHIEIQKNGIYEGAIDFSDIDNTVYCCTFEHGTFSQKLTPEQAAPFRDTPYDYYAHLSRS